MWEDDPGGGCWDDPFCGLFPPIPPCFWCGGGGDGGGSGGNGGGGSGSGGSTASAPFPVGSFPGGETLGLPPGLSVPGPFGIGMPNPFVFSVCSASPSACSDARFWNFYLYSWTRDWASALTLLTDFLRGGGATDRRYSTNDAVTQSLMRSGGFQSALRRACASGNPSGRFDVGTYEAAQNLSHDATYSATGVQVGGYLGTYTFKRSSMQISINNDAGAHSFFEHAAPNSPFSSGPLRTINQRFQIDLPNACGSSW